MVVVYQAERGFPEPPRSFEPMRPIMRRNLILTPTVLVPAIVLAGVALFLGYLYYQFTTFAVPPRIEVTDPAGDVVALSGEYVVRGRTTADARVTIRVFPGPETFADIRPAADGTFSAAVNLKPGANQVEVEVLDATGKVNKATRTIRYDIAIITPEQAPQLIVEQPANGGTYTNTPVTVSGRVDRSITSLVVNGTAVTPAADGRFVVTVTFQAGPQIVRVAARTASGAEVQETRTIAVAYTAAVVTVRIVGGDAWILATVDGTQAPTTNRIFTNGQTLTFSGRTVVIRTGNAGATYLSFNGQDLGKMGTTGQVGDRSFTYQ
jgi:nitrogen fixation protein FixH